MVSEIQEIQKIKGYEVLSNIGWLPIDFVIQTIPLEKKLVLFESGNLLECAIDHIVIDIENKEVYAKDLNIGDKIIGKDEIEVVFDILDLEDKECLYDLNLPYHHLFYANGILSHNSLGAINLGTRQAQHGENVVIFTLEMDEYSYCNRADGIFSGLDVNRMYLNKDSIKNLLTELKKTKQENNFGNLIIKDFPTGKATVGDLIVFIRELEIRGIKPSIIYVDYINLMAGKYKENSYLNIKTLAEELRAMSAMLGIPIITFSQLNREGGRISLQDLGLGYVSESKALEDTVDFMAIIGIDEDSITYENMLFWKIVKNRISGRKDTLPLYVDFRSLKMYDETEIDLWIADSAKSGDTRNIYERRE